MTRSLRDALDDVVRDVPAFGDVDQAFRTVQARRRRVGLVVAAGTAAAVAAFAVWGGILLTSARDLPPVSPRPTGHAWPSSVDVATTPRPLTGAPLPSGAGLALVVGRGSAFELDVAAGSEQRVVTTARRFGPIALSPDGRLLAYATIGFGQDAMVVVDLTTGDPVYDHVAVTYAGLPGQTLNLEWSADGRRLLQLTAATDDPEGPLEGRVWEPRGDRLVLVGSVDALPGAFVALNHDGTAVSAESAAHVAVASAGTGPSSWVVSSLPVPQPRSVAAGGSTRLQGLGQNRWAPDGRLIAWAAPGTGKQLSQVQLLDLQGRVVSIDVTGSRSVAFLGWRGERPVVERLSAGGATDVVALAPDGSVDVLSTLGYGVPVVSTTVAQDWLPG